MLATLFMPISCVAYSKTLKMEAALSAETSIYFQRTTLLISQKIELFITTALTILNVSISDAQLQDAAERTLQFGKQ
jgi:hypothetical protein